MPVPTREQELALGITPPPPQEVELDPKPKVKRVKSRLRRITRLPYELTEDQKTKIRSVMVNALDEWEMNTQSLRSKLRRANDLMEGIKEPKIFPWIGCSNLHMPIIEIHITILHSVVSMTMLEQEEIWYVKTLTEGLGESVDTDVEMFMNWSCKVNTRLDSDLSDIYWNAYKDGTAIGDLDWVEEYDLQYDILKFGAVEEFMAVFPNAESAGLTEKEYATNLTDLMEDGEIVVKVENTIVKYRGPKLRVVELKDFVMVPTSSPSTEYAMVVGDMFIQRADYFRRKVKEEWFDEDEVDKMLKQPGLSNAPDTISQSQDQIEGIGRNRITKPDEYYCFQGILKINLSDDDSEPERIYLITFHKHTKAIIRFECYPYIHNRIKYIPWRFKKRTNRFLGQSIYDQIVDINDEVDTQHNQRVDTRTITTVPSFLKLTTSDFDPTRSNQKFFPGVTFKVNSFNEIKQFDIKQTDMGSSLQEEQNLMLMAETRTGASQLRSGREVSRDPRAPAKKIALQIQQSNQRIDDHMRELRIGTHELGIQWLELWYQYAPDMISFVRKDPETQAFVQLQVQRQKLRSRAMFLEVAHTSVTDNPSMLVQKQLTIYELLSKEPLVGQNIFRRRENAYRVLKALREPNIEKLIPTVPQIIQELQQQQQMQSPEQPPTVQNLGQTLADVGPKRNSPDDRKRQGEPPARPVDTSVNAPVPQ